MAPPSVTPRSGSALYTVYMSTPTLSPPIRHYEGLFVHTLKQNSGLMYIRKETSFKHFIATHGIDMDNATEKPPSSANYNL